MNDRITSTVRKALALNQDPSRYGAFAEIGGGQEVARHFFRAGQASKTIAKTMSAYDMTVSDAIYGKTKRYVCESRLRKMLKHEYSLLQERLADERGKDCSFFSLANTVAIFSGEKKSHGWMGVRFQPTPLAPYTDVILHIDLNDPTRLQQQETLGRLGVNLLYACFYIPIQSKDFLSSLIDELSLYSLKINLICIEHSKESPNHQQKKSNESSNQSIDYINQVLNLKLVSQRISSAALFSPEGKILQAADCLFEKNVIVQRGTFRPITTVNQHIMTKGRNQFLSSHDIKPNSLFTLMEVAIQQNSSPEELQDIQQRIKILGSLGYYVLVSQFQLDYELKKYLRSNTSQLIGLLMGVSHLQRLFSEQYYEQIEGGILRALSQLFDSKCFLYVYPYKSDKFCTTADSFTPSHPNLVHLYQFFRGNSFIEALTGCDSVNTSLRSSKVRELLKQGDPQWEQMVPTKAVELIKKEKLFGLP